MPNDEHNVEQSLYDTGGIPEIEMEVDVSGMTQYPVDRTLSIEDMAADAKAVGERFIDVEASIAEVSDESRPVGSIFMTISQDPPSFFGTWVEIAITATWTQLKNGTRGYELLDDGETGGAVHFWLRVE